MKINASWLMVAIMFATPLPAVAQTDADATAAAPLVATQVREQGFECTEPTGAQRDPNADGDAVWILTCGNGSYRVRLVPDQAASIEPLQ
jgi:hypothetical protein